MAQSQRQQIQAGAQGGPQAAQFNQSIRGQTGAAPVGDAAGHGGKVSRERPVGLRVDLANL